MSSRKQIRKPSKPKSGGINISGDIIIHRSNIAGHDKVAITPLQEGENVAPRMAGDTTTDAPPPEVRKRKKRKGE